MSDDVLMPKKTVFSHFNDDVLMQKETVVRHLDDDEVIPKGNSFQTFGCYTQSI